MGDLGVDRMIIVNCIWWTQYMSVSWI